MNENERDTLVDVGDERPTVKYPLAGIWLGDDDVAEGWGDESECSLRLGCAS